jgi:TatD DNase family protein
MIFSDTHTHLYLEEFDEDRGLVIEEAINSGVQYLFLPNVDSSTIAAMLELADKFPGNCFPMIGVHPTSINASNVEGEINAVKQWLQKRKFFAIGDIGIDLYWDKTFLQQQKTAFNMQVELSITHHLPLVIHSRNSLDLIIQILKTDFINKPLRAVFHCYPGNLIQAKKLIDMGFMLGIGGVLTYKNAGLAEVVKYIGLEHILLETDAPYLTPVPYRGKRNKSLYILNIAQKLAEIKKVSLETVAEITANNALCFFGLK